MPLYLCVDLKSCFRLCDILKNAQMKIKKQKFDENWYWAVDQNEFDITDLEHRHYKAVFKGICDKKHQDANHNID